MKMIRFVLLVLLLAALVAFEIGTSNAENAIHNFVHPKVIHIPNQTMLDTGEVISSKMKSLAAGQTKAYDDATNDIRAIHMADSLPGDFVASDANTISAKDSEHPVYIFFDNENKAGIMYVYSGNNQIVMNADSSFAFCMNASLSDISGLSDWDASNITSMVGIFFNDASLATLHGLEDWDTGNVTNMSGAFCMNASLSDISGLSDWDTGNVTRMIEIFSDDVSLTSLHGLEDWDTGNVTDMSGAFCMNASLSDISGLSGWDTSNVTSMVGIFSNDTSLATLHGLEKWNTRNVRDMSALFSGATELKDTSALTYWDTSSVTDMSFMFSENLSLTSIDVSKWDTSNVTDMTSMFQVGTTGAGNGALSEIRGLENWNVSNVIDMTCMFYGAGQMTHYDIANWDVSRVQSFNHMFCDNLLLESLDLSAWNVQSVKTMYDMFDDAHALTTIGDVSHWNTANLIDIGGWLNGADSFVGDNGLLDLSGWYTSNLKAAGEAFRDTKLETIDLSGWTFDSIINGEWEEAGRGIYYEYGNQPSYPYPGINSMFKDSKRLSTVYISQSGLDSFHEAIAKGINVADIWTGTLVSEFTLKPEQ